MVMFPRASTELQALLDAPAMAAPPGMDHNFVNPTKRGTTAQSITIFCLSLSVLAVGMRMWTNTRVIRRVFLEDCACCLALATFAGHCAVIFILNQKHNYGVHLWDIRLKDLSYYLYYSRIIIALYCIEIFLIKVAILVQFLRVFVPLKTRNWMFWACQVLIWLNFIFYLISGFLTIFTCKPVKKIGNSWIEETCIDAPKIITVSSAFNAASDFLILILPQPAIWSLQMARQKKMALSAVFLVGICACASSSTRIHYSVKIFQTKDLTYFYPIVELCTIIEVASGILAACLPCSPKFFRGLKDSTLWCGLRNALHLYAQSNTTSTPISTRSNENKPARIHNGLSSLNALFKKHNILPVETELTTTTSMKGRKESNTDTSPWTETSQDLESMRTTHTTTTEETNLAPIMPKPNHP